MILYQLENESGRPLQGIQVMDHSDPRLVVAVVSLVTAIVGFGTTVVKRHGLPSLQNAAFLGFMLFVGFAALFAKPSETSFIPLAPPPPTQPPPQTPELIRQFTDREGNTWNLVGGDPAESTTKFLISAPITFRDALGSTTSLAYGISPDTSSLDSRVWLLKSLSQGTVTSTRLVMFPRWGRDGQSFYDRRNWKWSLVVGTPIVRGPSEMPGWELSVRKLDGGEQLYFLGYSLPTTNAVAVPDRRIWFRTQ